MPDSRSTESAKHEERRLQGQRLGAFVRSRWRDRSGIRGLSRSVGVSRATLYSWFNGDSAPDTGQLTALAAAMGADPAELMAVMAGDRAPDVTPAEQSDPRLEAVADRAVARYRDQLSLEVDRLVGGQAADRWSSAIEERSSPGIMGFVAESPEMSLASASSIPPRRVRSTRLVELFRDQVVDTCAAGEPIGPVMRRMYERAFSQLPVYEGDGLVGLLTTDTIARWHAAGSGSDRRSQVREVLNFAETAATYRLLGPNATADDALELFDSAAQAGVPLQAILVTSTGGPSGRPLAIMTPADRVRLNSAKT